MLACCAIAVSPVQDDSPFEAPFIWFPADDYLELSYAAVGEIRAAEGFALYRDCVDPQLTRLFGGSPLPAALRDEIVAVANGRAVRGRVTWTSGTSADSVPERLKGANILGGRMTKSGNYMVIGADEFSWHAISSRAHFINAAKAGGFLSESGESIQGSPVYLLHVDPAKGDGGEYFAWFTPLDELLVTGSRPLLVRMIAAGTGEKPSLIDDEAYARALVDLAGYGNHWSLYNQSALDRAILDAMEKRGEPKEVTQPVEESIAGASLDYLGLLVNQGLTRFAILAFADKASAQSASAEFRASMEEGASFESSGSLLIERLAYTDDIVTRERTRMELMLKQFRERQEAAKVKE
jgi:hypothetical protein